MITIFGKARDGAEFVREGAFGAFEGALETAMLAEVERGRGPAPARFLAAERGALHLGAWIGSHDALGRSFPLVLSLALDERSLLPIVPLHYAQLLAAAERALLARRAGERALPVLLRPHPSLLLPRLHRARAQLLRASALRVAHWLFGVPEAGRLVYALSALLRAVQLGEPVALALPSAREGALSLWLELLGALGPLTALSLVWSPRRVHAGLGINMKLSGLLSRREHGWPTYSDEPLAYDEARSLLGTALCASIEGDLLLGVVLRELADVAGRAHAS